MPERPVTGDGSTVAHQPSIELPRDPRGSVDDADDAHDAAGADDPESHDPYQPL
ncbi:hypothetical protein GCM10009541_23560 [Micromonospora gifhornensis]|uniref:Uncharacterized protein n=1 Tax=Micromonospora gifhornensis TaxID=84594 RepID=A0ABQ4IH78_9ACTN|nr:hypothetical protein [Micromonospora gifhornensis]GIJ17263.1 hypothetical protein Vgi01_39470 [Micromonospora gifhornensis]